jgi:hypothetical protein
MHIKPLATRPFRQLINFRITVWTHRRQLVKPGLCRVPAVKIMSPTVARATPARSAGVQAIIIATVTMLR